MDGIEHLNNSSRVKYENAHRIISEKNIIVLHHIHDKYIS